MTGRRIFFALVLLLIPVSHGVKLLLGLKLWIDPALLVTLAMFLLYRPQVQPFVSLLVVVAGFVSAYAGYVLSAPVGSDLYVLYRVFEEPVRLALGMVFFWVSVAFFKEGRQFALKWLTVSIVSQLLIGGYNVLVVIGLLPAPDFWQVCLDRLNSSAQVAQLGDVAVPRMAGIFVEPAPFGLFMLSGVILFSLALLTEKNNSRWVRFGLVASLLGTICSLSEQVLLGLLPFVAGLAVALGGKKRAAFRVAVVAIACVLLPNTVDRLMTQREQAVELKEKYVQGTSGGERAFHIGFAYDLLARGTVPWETGAGPGRYGEYAAQTGMFETIPTPQVTLVEWVIGFGVVGTAFILIWLWTVSREALRTYGVALGLSAFAALLLSNMFQSNWISEAWFLALAYLAATPDTAQKPGEAKRQTSRVNGTRAVRSDHAQATLSRFTETC